MKKIVASIVGVAILVFASLNSAQPNRPDSDLTLGQIQTDNSQEFSKELFRGCPHATYRVQMPPPIGPDPIWTDTMENINKELQKDLQIRQHVAPKTKGRILPGDPLQS